MNNIKIIHNKIPKINSKNNLNNKFKKQYKKVSNNQLMYCLLEYVVVQVLVKL